MGEAMNGETVDSVKAKKMVDRIIKLEKLNIQTKHLSDRETVEKIKTIIREEADAYVG